MLGAILLIFFSLVFLIILHEFGHFIFAKIFKVKVEEFGIFLPPPIFKKKIGETQFSINLLPFGAFVRLFGETELKKEKGSFSGLPISKRVLIVLGGAVSFWIIAFVIFFFLSLFGIPEVLDKDSNLSNLQVKIIQVFEGTPAQVANLRIGDEILEIEGEKIQNANHFLEKVTKNLGKEITLTIKRGQKIFSVKLTPRISPPENQGPLGVVIVNVKIQKYPFFKAFFKSFQLVFSLTLQILFGYFKALKNLVLREKTGLTLTGPIGASFYLWQSLAMGFPYFLSTLSLFSLYLAIFNLLPIPALDGGKILFLMIEALRKKPVSKETEEKITAFFFLLFILLFVLVTIKDIKRLFLP